MKKNETPITKKICVFNDNPCEDCWDEAYEEYLAECKEEDEEPMEKYDWIYRQLEYDADDLRSNLKCVTKNRKEHWFVDYTLGLWNGRPKGAGVRPNLEKLYYDAFQDYNDVSTSEDGKHLVITAIHHDGTNTYDAYPVSGETADAIQEMIDDGKDADSIREFAFANTLPLTYEMLGL